MPLRRLAAIGLAAAAIAACAGSTEPAHATRTYRMGFSSLPPRLDSADFINALLLWLPRADAGIIHTSIPWTALIAGATPESAVVSVHGPIAAAYRARAMALVVTLDVTNGLDRSAEDPALVAAGHSITEAAMQHLYRRYAVALDTLLRPDYLGLAAETNLIRAAAPAAVYAAVVAMTNAAAQDIRAVDAARQLYVSAQVEVAWGRLTGSGPYVGIDQDYTDFPFISALGLSSYPYLGGFTDPADLPDDYYSRLAVGRTTPELVVEGGWAAASAPGFTSDPAKQARYLTRQRVLLDRAAAVGLFQLEFADIDTTGLGLPSSSILPLFTSIGLVDSVLRAKPALAAWDSGFARHLVP